MTDVDDEEQLGALFRAAAADPAAPAPRFDHNSVVRAARRATARRRAALTGAGLALVAVVGVGTAVVRSGGLVGGGDSVTVAAPMIAPGEDNRAQSDAAGPADPHAQRAAPPPAAEGAPEAAPAPEAAHAGPPPLGPGTAECADRQDPALRALVEQVLPEVVGAPDAAITMECRPPGERGVNVEVRDGAATGLLTVQYLPPGIAPEPAYEAVVTPTASGGTVVVSSRPSAPGAPAPLADRLVEAASYLAPRL